MSRKTNIHFSPLQPASQPSTAFSIIPPHCPAQPNPNIYIYFNKSRSISTFVVSPCLMYEPKLWKLRLSSIYFQSISLQYLSSFFIIHRLPAYFHLPRLHHWQTSYTIIHHLLYFFFFFLKSASITSSSIVTSSSHA